jgi:hypothetical protein
MRKCLACGVEKDASVKEGYPYPDDGLIHDPIDPFMVIDCKPRGNPATEWREVTVCHHCFHKLDADMWISDHCWRALNPTVPFEELPKRAVKP